MNVEQKNRRIMYWHQKPVSKDISENGLLAPGVSMADLEAKHLTLDGQRILGILRAYVGSPEYAWLNGQVGGGRRLFEEHRGQILAKKQYETARDMFARVPHPALPLMDSERGVEVDLNLNTGSEGIELLGWDLATKIGELGLIDYNSAAFYWHCWRETAQVAIRQMVEQGILEVQPMNEFKISPDVIRQARRLEEIEGRSMSGIGLVK